MNNFCNISNLFKWAIFVFRNNAPVLHSTRQGQIHRTSFDYPLVLLFISTSGMI